MFGLADIALWFAAFTEIGIEPMAVTSELSIRFLRPAQGGDLLARATLASVSTRRMVGSIDLWVDGGEDRLVAVAQGTYVRPGAARLTRQLLVSAWVRRSAANASNDSVMSGMDFVISPASRPE